MDVDWFVSQGPAALIAFGIGCGGGYTFAMRTTLATAEKHMQAAIEDLKERVTTLEVKLEERTNELLELAKLYHEETGQ